MKWFIRKMPTKIVFEHFYKWIMKTMRVKKQIVKSKFFCNSIKIKMRAKITTETTIPKRKTRSPSGWKFQYYYYYSITNRICTNEHEHSKSQLAFGWIKSACTHRKSTAKWMKDKNVKQQLPPIFFFSSSQFHLLANRKYMG